MHGPGQPDASPAGRWRAPAATGPVQATVTVPGSKSMTNRALILAALADGPTTITGALRARDTRLMAGALGALGHQISAPDQGAWLVTPGQAGRRATVDVGNAGTVLRFVPPVAALTRAEVEFTGDSRAAERPLQPMLAALRELGATISDGGRGGIPFLVTGQGGLPGGRVTLDASGSSQFVSGLLLAAPCYAQGAEISHDGPKIPSLPHIDMTVQMLLEAGADVETGHRRGDGSPAWLSVPDIWRVYPGALRPASIAVQPDLSAAAPFLAAALVTGGTVTVRDWPARTSQPAGPILDVLTAMGAAATMTRTGLTLTGSGQVTGVSANLSDIGELTPVLTAVAALADSPSVFTGIGHLRRHESDRLAALAAEIGALGGDVTEQPDGLEIRPRPLRAAGSVFDSHDDHRLVMAAAVLGLAVPGLTVGNAGTVGKTFPAFTGAWSAMLEPTP